MAPPSASSGAIVVRLLHNAILGGSYAIFMSLQIANTAGYTKRSVTSAGIFVGYCIGEYFK